MKRILKFLTRFYPSGWRERYGAEFETLIEEGTPRARDIVDVLSGALKMQAGSWSFVRITLATALAGLLAGLAISLASLPPQYTAETFVTVAANRMKLPLNSARLDYPEKASEAEIAFVLNNSKDSFLSAASLAQIIKDEDLYSHDRDRTPTNAVLDNMRKNITTTPGHNGNLAGFTLKFAYSDPQVAQKVARELTDRWMDATIRGGVEKSQSAGRPWPPLVFRVSEEQVLSKKLISPDRLQRSALGLLAGLAGGLTLATTVAITRQRRQENA